MAIYKNTPPVVTDGLVLYLDAANRLSYVSGSTAWNDMSGRGNNGTLINGPTYSSANGGSIVFDGVNDYIGTLTSLTLTNQLTVSCWVSFISIPSGVSFRGIIGDWNTGNSTRSWLITKNNSDNKFVFFVNGSGLSGGNVGVLSNTLISLNQIYNVVGVYNGSTISIYIDGELQNTNDFSSNLFQGTLFNLGRFAATNYANINLYSSLVYNRALSSTEVLQNYNSTKSRFNLS
jgi:hypothetical protein